MNEKIAKRIREARKERGLTQQDLANQLGRTAAAISDLERGKVQVNATDLYQISQFLNRPIEYFYGEDYLGSDVQDLIAIIRKMPKDIRKEILPNIKIMLQMQEIGDRAQKTSNEQELKVLAQEFFNLLIPYVDSINKLSERSKQIQNEFSELLEINTPE